MDLNGVTRELQRRSKSLRYQSRIEWSLEPEEDAKWLQITSVHTLTRISLTISVAGTFEAEVWSTRSRSRNKRLALVRGLTISAGPEEVLQSLRETTSLLDVYDRLADLGGDPYSLLQTPLEAIWLRLGS